MKPTRKEIINSFVCSTNSVDVGIDMTDHIVFFCKKCKESKIKKFYWDFNEHLAQCCYSAHI